MRHLTNIRTARAIRLDIERTRQRIEHLTREQAQGEQQDIAPIWNALNLLCVYYCELNDLVGHVLDLEVPAIQSQDDSILLITEDNQDGEVVTLQAYHERLALMTPLDRATHTAIPVAPEVANEVERELNTLKQGFNHFNRLTKKIS
jgi:hypothetical protein